MKKAIIFLFLICLFTSCGSLYPQTDKIKLGMSKQEVLSHLNTMYGRAKSSGARVTSDDKLEETIDLTDGYDKYTFVFTEGVLTEWFTVDVRTIIPPAPTIIQSASPSTEIK